MVPVELVASGDALHIALSGGEQPQPVAVKLGVFERLPSAAGDLNQIAVQGSRDEDWLPVVPANGPIAARWACSMSGSLVELQFAGRSRLRGSGVGLYKVDCFGPQ